MNAYSRTFLYIYLARFIIDRVFFILGGDFHETIHLVVRYDKIFQPRTFLPHYGLQKIIVLLEICNLFPASMYEYKIGNIIYFLHKNILFP